MSEKLYTIQEQTLTDIANAIRQKNPETELAIGPCPAMITKSPNAVGHDDVVSEGVPSLIMSCFASQIEGASSIKVIVSCYLGRNDTVSLFSGNYTTSDYNNGRIPSDAQTRFDTNTLITRQEYTFANTDAITFYIWMYASTDTGLYAEIIGYDADGIPVATENTIEIETERPAPLSFTSAEMAAAISRIPEVQRVEPIVLTGDCSYACFGPMAGTYIDLFGDTISTSNINTASSMFQGCTAAIIPFEINFNLNSAYHNISNFFYKCNNLRSIPKLNNAKPYNIEHMFDSCFSLTEIPEDIEDWFNWNYLDTLTSAYSGNQSYMFYSCYNLRKIPMGLLSHGNPVVYYSYSIFNSLASGCYALDEITELPNPHTSAVWTGNAFTTTVTRCARLKNFTFATPDGAPYVVSWKNQTIDLSQYVGYGQYRSNLLDSIALSGITADKEVTDDASYQVLKDDPDWWTIKIEYSRYNHDSAVATINSLPDTSAYLATAGGTNTIKFKGAAGSKTDGGAINTLTAEEIAVATAKGWTVTLS